VAVLHRRVQILQQPYAVVAAGGRSPVAGQLDEVELVVDADRPREVADERDARLQRADEQRLAPVVVALQLAAELPYPRRDLLGVEEDLADPLVAWRQRAQDAFRRPYRAASRSKSRS
jgi:hypothetical protein